MLSGRIHIEESVKFKIPENVSNKSCAKLDTKGKWVMAMFVFYRRCLHSLRGLIYPNHVKPQPLLRK